MNGGRFNKEFGVGLNKKTKNRPTIKRVKESYFVIFNFYYEKMLRGPCKKKVQSLNDTSNLIFNFPDIIIYNRI